MALEATHIRFAFDLKDVYDVSDIDAFVSGSIYPDSRYVTGIDRLATHPEGYLNDPEFKYRLNNMREINLVEKFGGPEHKGFMTAYSLTGIEEDKAEIFACLMMSSQSKLLHRWIKDDQILKEKVQFIKSFIPKFCPEMNDQFWNKILL